jgi:hydrogenase-4 membrane subunit HyfE
MVVLLQTIYAIGLLTCFALLGTSRIGACIRWLSFQGTLFGMVPLIVHDGRLTIREVALAVGNVSLKGIVFPWLLLRLRARAGYNREVQPFVSFMTSIMFGILALALSAWLTTRPSYQQPINGSMSTPFPHFTSSCWRWCSS